MEDDGAQDLYRTGRAHAGAACLLYAAAVHHAADEGIEDPVQHVFNGQNSLTIMHLVGLGLELMLKAAILYREPEVPEKFLRLEVGHDLKVALEEAAKRGFVSHAPHLQEVVDVLRDPYRKHWFRYARPEAFGLPDDFDQIVGMFQGLEAELEPLFTEPTPAAA